MYAPSLSFPQAVSQYLEKILKSPNKPKKEAKFKNFCKNTFKIDDAKILHEVWVKYSAQQKP